MSTDAVDAVDGYLAHLPDVLRRDPTVVAVLRIAGTALADLERPVADLPRHLDPRHADPEFLPWLAEWLAAPTGPPPRDESALRNLLCRIVPLYRHRGTAIGLRRMLGIALPDVARVTVHDDVGPAYFFAVKIVPRSTTPDELSRVEGIARAVIEREKPVHTFYALRLVVPRMRLVSVRLHETETPSPPRLVLGENTVLGTET